VAGGGTGVALAVALAMASILKARLLCRILEAPVQAGAGH
jgi:hypothetical protein